MKKHTHTLYARHASVQSSAATLAVHTAQQAVTRVEDEIDAQQEISTQQRQQVNETLSHGAAAALMSLHFHAQLHREQHTERLQHELSAQKAQLDAAISRRTESRKKEKSAQKMGEHLQAQARRSRQRQRELEQDELVVHVLP